GGNPVFTPDGAWIVYVARTTRGHRLFRVRPDGTGRTPLGAGVQEENHPAVSPDGRYVAFVVTETTRRERIWVRRIDGTGDRPLLTSGDGSVPVWWTRRRIPCRARRTWCRCTADSPSRWIAWCRSSGARASW